MLSENKSFIQTERLLVEHLNKKYVNDIFHEKNNPEVNEYLSNQTAKTIEDLAEWMDGVIKYNGNGGIIQFQVSKIENQEFIWMCAVKKTDTIHPEIWLRIKQSARWKWYGKEMVSSLLYRIKKYMPYEYIIYETFEDNIWSKKIIESLGWVQNHEYNKIINNYYGKPLKHIQYKIYEH